MLPVHRGAAVHQWGERQVPLAPPLAVRQAALPFQPTSQLLLQWPVAASRPMGPSCRDAADPVRAATQLERSTSAWLAVTTCPRLSCYQRARR